MKVLVTGSAGFIGFHLCNSLLKKKNLKIVGIDNLNEYYSVKLKKLRLSILKKNKKFKFYKIDISNFKKLKKLFETEKFDMVINMAAQAGVRYSILNPREYVLTNILGFHNIIELSKNFKIKKLFYASSSSVYGDQKKFPVNETNKLLPKNIYSMSKKNNEDTAEIYSQQYGIKCIGLRFFTVYGEWGRPDMLMIKYMLAKNKKLVFKLNNKGNHFRDFTFIKDVISILEKLIFCNIKKRHSIFNICSNNPISVKRVLKKIDFLFGGPKIKYEKKLKIEAYKTHGSNKKVILITKKGKFTNIDKGLKYLVNWAKIYLNKI